MEETVKTIKRPKICVPIIERGRDSILDKAEEYAKLPVDWQSGVWIFMPAMRGNCLVLWKN